MKPNLVQESRERAPIYQAQVLQGKESNLWKLGPLETDIQHCALSATTRSVVLHISRVSSSPRLAAPCVTGYHSNHPLPEKRPLDLPRRILNRASASFLRRFHQEFDRVAGPPMGQDRLAEARKQIRRIAQRHRYAAILENDWR
jgi:hypothetical protein